MTEPYLSPVARVIEDDGLTRTVEYANGSIGEQTCMLDENEQETWLDQFDGDGYPLRFHPDEEPWQPS